jgi:diphthamide biosynthesis protein 2
LKRRLRADGYTNVLATEVVRNPAGLIPNRRVVPAEGSKEENFDDEVVLKTYALFHISDPAPSLLLSLYNRFSSLYVLSTPSTEPITLDNPTFRTAALLRRRFARVLSLSSAGVIGILVNTLSVTTSLASIDHLRRRIADAGKKSYTVVVGRLNPAKLANFSEVEGWVVVGCWEGGLIEGEEGYWRPVVTPFELEVALMSEDERIWGAEWWGGTEKLKIEVEEASEKEKINGGHGPEKTIGDGAPELEVDDGVEGEESLPPEFDLRTGRLVSHSRPMRQHLPIRSAKNTTATTQDASSGENSATALIQRSRPGELASVNGVVSPGAEYLRSQRTWQGLGSDFAENPDEARSTGVEEGRSGIARGYTVGEVEDKH